ncbi:DUF421 domain-containing protein [Candidatus Woesearchaeota archaeon]|nr:DUF421 domain-containing protein [Candidatus Woesearchaeota archaeon]
MLKNNKKGESALLMLLTIILTVALIYFVDLYAPNFAKMVSFSDMAIVVIRTLVIFVFAFIMLRLLGKRQLSQLTFIDLLIIIALGSAVGDVMIYQEDVAPMIGSVIAVGFIALLVRGINMIIAKHASLGRMIEGRSTVLVKHGKIVDGALRKENMNTEELMSELREHNIRRVGEVEEAILEPTGNLSVRRRRAKKNK